MLPSLAAGADAWKYNWATRVDRDGQPAGIYTQTPYPITETSSNYFFKTDEFPDGKCYNLGTLYFVDGARPDDSGNGLSLATAKKTISAAITAAGSGNKTILVRGAHGSFNGVYTERIGFYGLSGVDDTHRLMLVGYGQERPVINGGNSESSIVGRGHPSPAYITIQRLKLTGTQASGVRLGWDIADDKRDTYFNCIDVWFYACGNNMAFLTSGNCYYLNTDNGFLSHCLFERSTGHGVKIGDGSSHCILEWSVSRENGWWPGKMDFSSRTVAIDMPSDRDTGHDCVVRYCVASGCVSHGLQLRRARNFNVHHNEIFDYGHGLGMTNSMSGVVPSGVLILSSSWGQLTENVVHTPYAHPANGPLIDVESSITNDVLIANNLIYDSSPAGNAIYAGYGNAARVLMYNNTVVASNSTYLIGIASPSASQTRTNEIVNNILWQIGTGRVGEMIYHSVKPMHAANVIYAPKGSLPEWDTTNDIVADPLLQETPKGSFSADFLTLQSDSPAIGAGVSGAFVPPFDITGRSRSERVDVGAAQEARTIPAPPSNFRSF